MVLSKSNVAAQAAVTFALQPSGAMWRKCIWNKNGSGGMFHSEMGVTAEVRQRRCSPVQVPSEVTAVCQCSKTFSPYCSQGGPVKLIIGM